MRKNHQIEQQRPRKKEYRISSNLLRKNKKQNTKYSSIFKLKLSNYGTN
jgi:hypothetical protein